MHVVHVRVVTVSILQFTEANLIGFGVLKISDANSAPAVTTLGLKSNTTNKKIKLLFNS